MLFLLCSSQRVPTLSVISLDDILFVENGNMVVFQISEPLKQYRGGSMGLITFKAFVQDVKLCFVAILKE